MKTEAETIFCLPYLLLCMLVGDSNQRRRGRGSEKKWVSKGSSNCCLRKKEKKAKSTEQEKKYLWRESRKKVTAYVISYVCFWRRKSNNCKSATKEDLGRETERKGNDSKRRKRSLPTHSYEHQRGLPRAQTHTQKKRHFRDFDNTSAHFSMPQRTYALRRHNVLDSRRGEFSLFLL